MAAYLCALWAKLLVFRRNTSACFIFSWTGLYGWMVDDPAPNIWCLTVRDKPLQPEKTLGLIYSIYTVIATFLFKTDGNLWKKRKWTVSWTCLLWLSAWTLEVKLCGPAIILELFGGVHLSLISLIGRHLERHNQLSSVLSPNWYHVLV